MPEIALDAPLKSAFDNLAAANAAYVVLRGYMPLSALTASADVDLYVRHADFPAAKIALSNAGWCYRATQVGRYPHHFFDRWDGTAGFVRSLDVVTDLHFGPGSRQLHNSELILKSAIFEQGVRIPSPWHAALCFALHLILDKGHVSDANSLRAREFLNACEQDTENRQLLGQHFGEASVELVQRAMTIASGSERQNIISLLSTLGSLKHLGPPVRLRVFTHRLRVRLRQFARPVVRVAVIGIDGSGKSTLISTISANGGTVRIHSGYLGDNSFRTWPALILQSRLSQMRTLGTDRGLWHRILVNLDTLWRPVELAVRMAIAEHRAEIVLYDRFPLGQDDGDPTTPWGKIVSAYTKFWRRLRPVPDLVVLLDGDERTIWSRKKEMPFELHQRTQARYRKFVGGLACHTAIISTDCEIEKTIDEFRIALSKCTRVRSHMYKNCAP